MGYLENQLNVNEQVVAETEHHFSAYVGALILAIIFIIIGYALGSGTNNHTMLAIGIILGLLILFGRYLRLVTTKLGITTKRVIGRVGIISRESLDAPLKKVDNVSIKKGLFGAIFGYGSVKIATSSGTFVFDGVSKPDDFKKLLFAEIEKNENAGK